MDNILLSIIIPVYNVEKYINRCLDSILCQKKENYEVILVDDGSTDGSGIICDSYGPEDIRGKFVEGTTHLKRRKASGRKPVSFGIILIIIAFLIYLWHYLATGSWSF